MNKPWKVILVLIGIFAAGAVTGGFVALEAYRDKINNRPVPEEWELRHLKRLSERLELTEEQKTQVRPIIRNKMEQLNRMRNQAMGEARIVVEAMQREISTKLTPDQRIKFESMNRELREAREKHDREKDKKDKEKPREKGMGEPGPGGSMKAPPPPPSGEAPGK